METRFDGVKVEKYGYLNPTDCRIHVPQNFDFYFTFTF